MKDAKSENIATLIKFLRQRQEMLSIYWSIAGLSKTEKESKKEKKNKFKQNESLAESNSNDNFLNGSNTQVRFLRKLSQEYFCQILLDYSCFGHFKIYPMVIEGIPSSKKIDAIFKSILETTDTILAFNDCYEKIFFTGNEQEKLELISNLGESIELRFECEDWLLTQLYKKLGVQVEKQNN